MPKSIYIDPEKTLRPEEHEIVFPEIPVMQYKKTVKDELAEGNFTKDDLLRIYHEQRWIFRIGSNRYWHLLRREWSQMTNSMPQALPMTGRQGLRCIRLK